MTNPSMKKGPTLPVAPNSFKKLPASSTKFLVTIDTPTGEGDGDFWLARVYADGHAEILSWYNHEYDRPDLGVNSQGNPYQAFSELDVITTGDDRTGGESEVRKAKGEAEYDEGGKLDLSRAPNDVVAYVPFVTIYDEHDVGLTLGQFSRLSMVIIDEATGVRFETSPAATDPLALCYVPGAIRRSGPGAADWAVHGTEDENTRGTTDNPWVVSNKLGASLKTP
jgi:stress response protein SCP2